VSARETSREDLVFPVAGKKAGQKNDP